jgi:hypothetical protein
MWYVVEAYAGERSFYFKFNWPFLGADVVSPKLHHILLNCHRDLQFTVYKFRSNKKEIWDVHVKQIINIFGGLGKESGGCWRGGYFKFG